MFAKFNTPIRHGKKTLVMLGKLLVMKRPDVAAELMPYAKVGQSDDLANIPKYFNSYCKEIGVSPEELTGDLKHSRERVKQRAIFILSMLHIFNHNILYVPEAAPVMRLGFVNKLSECLKVSRSTISEQIRQVLFYETQYETYKVQSQEMITKLKAAG